MIEKRAPDRMLAVTIAVAFLIKLWLTSETRIIAAAAPHDSLNYLEHAKSIAMGLWFGSYDNLTLIKQPFFPMYMAGLQEFGIPLPIGHLLIYGLACAVACLAIKPLIQRPYLLCAMFVVLYFNPMENNGDSWLSTRAQINPSMALLTLSCAIGLFLRRRTEQRPHWRWSLALGVTFAGFWLTREEALWMLPALAVLAAGYLLAPLRAKAWAQLRPRLISTAIPIACWIAAVGAVMLLNGIHYGWYTTAENLSPEFVSAYNSLARIDPGVPADRHFPVPHAARLIAYRVSPSARALEPSFEHGRGLTWASFGCQQFQICGDIHAGWFIWAFRDAVADAGFYTSGASARAFYITLANQIDTACVTAQIACTAKRRTLAPPVSVSDLPTIASHWLTGALIGVTFSEFTTQPWQNYVGPASIRPDYDFITRSVDDGFPHEPAGIDDDLKRAVLVQTGQIYQLLVPMWMALAALACIARLVTRTAGTPPDVFVVCAAIATAFGSLVLVLSLVDALSFPSFNPEYLSPLFPLVLFFVTIVTALEAPVLARRINRYLPASQG